jgi:hypothetical protein
LERRNNKTRLLDIPTLLDVGVRPAQAQDEKINIFENLIFFSLSRERDGKKSEISNAKKNNRKRTR